MKPPRWTAKQVDVLRVIAEADQPLCGVEIAKALDINRGRVYPIIKRMHGYGILMRHRKTATSTRYMYGVTRFGAAYTRAVLEGAGRPELCKLFDALAVKEIQ